MRQAFVSCCTWDKTTESHLQKSQHRTIDPPNKVLTAFSKRNPLLSITRATSAKNAKSGENDDRRGTILHVFFFYQTSAPLLTKSRSFFQYTLNVVLLIFIIIMESFSQPVSWTKVVCPRDREGKRFSNPPADAAYYSHRSKTSSFDGMTERRIWRPWGHSGYPAAPRFNITSDCQSLVSHRTIVNIELFTIKTII